MSGKASEITDPVLLFARIGYRTYLARHNGDQSLADLYERYVRAELHRLAELRGKRPSPVG